MPDLACDHEFALQALQHRADGKLYRIQTPQTPIARTKRYDTYKMDEFPSGMNMMVAVLAYTGQSCAVLWCAFQFSTVV